MAKRFTDTEKYKKPFVRSLKGPYKLLWDYLYHDCDNAGIWIVDFEIAQIYLGADMKVNEADALKYFNADQYRVHPFDGGKKWFIPSFIPFQYSKLGEKNPAHTKVISTLLGLGFLIAIPSESEEAQSSFVVPPLGTMVMDTDVVVGRDMATATEKVRRPEKQKPIHPGVIEVIQYLNELNGTNFRTDTKATLKLIEQRFAEGFPISELKEIIEYKVAEWKGTSQDKWLQPDTLFNGENCAKYRNQVQAAKDKGMSITQIRARQSGPKSKEEMLEEFRIAQAKKYATQ